MVTFCQEMFSTLTDKNNRSLKARYVLINHNE